jgi:hypothetical protein
MTEKQYRDRWLKQHRQYENIVRVKLTKEFRKLSNNIPFDFLNESNYNVIIRSAIKEDDILNLYYDFYKEIGIIHAKRVGKLLNKQIKEFTVNGFLSVFEKDLLGWLYGNSLSRITSVQQGLISYLQEFIATGIAENKTISELTTDIQNLINRRDFYRWQSMRIARTETTAAANYASTIVSRTSGIVNEKIWISSTDARTRRMPESEFNHLAMNGVKVGENETFKVPSKFGVEELRFAGDPKGSAGNVINCYLPNNFIESNIIEGQKSFYSGEAIEIITRKGESITVTPNHGILTTNGFIRAKDIQIGDNLVCNRLIKNRIIRLVNNYIKKKFFSVQNVFSSLQTLWFSKRLVITALDFDTDGESMNGYINIVYPKVFLNRTFISKVIKHIANFSFVKSFLKCISISGFSSFNFFSSRNNSTFRRLMSFLYLAFPLLFGHFRPLNTLTLGLASKINSKRFKTSSEGLSTDSDFLRELIKTDSAIISFDNVVNIRYFNYSGHVYDFSSYNGVNIVNNIYTSNCRCANALVPKRDANGRFIRR